MIDILIFDNARNQPIRVKIQYLLNFLNIDTDLVFIMSVFHCVVSCGWSWWVWVRMRALMRMRTHNAEMRKLI